MLVVTGGIIRQRRDTPAPFFSSLQHEKCFSLYGLYHAATAQPVHSEERERSLQAAQASAWSVRPTSRSELPSLCSNLPTPSGVANLRQGTFL